MFGFARRRRFLEYDYVPLVVNRDLRDVHDEEDEYQGEEATLGSQVDASESVAGIPEAALDAAGDRERVSLPAL